MGKQYRDSQAGGAQAVGGVPKARLHQPPKFMGKAGTPDNQSTSRGKGKS